jgi:hypothetical protein
MQEQFEQHSLDEAGRAHAGHLGEFLSRCPGLRGQREKPVSAGMWATHNHRREHIWGQGPSTGSRPVFAVLSLALAGLAAVRDVYGPHRPCPTSNAKTGAAWLSFLFALRTIGERRYDDRRKPRPDGTLAAALPPVSLRRTVARLGRATANAWAFVVNSWRRVRGHVGRNSHALNNLRRLYVFGSLGRQQFEEGVQKLDRPGGKRKHSRRSTRGE